MENDKQQKFKDKLKQSINNLSKEDKRRLVLMMLVAVLLFTLIQITNIFI